MATRYRGCGGWRLVTSGSDQPCLGWRIRINGTEEIHLWAAKGPDELPDVPLLHHENPAAAKANAWDGVKFRAREELLALLAARAKR